MTLPTIHCEMCGQVPVTLIARKHGAFNQAFDIVRCRRCGLQFVQTFPTPQQLEKLYSKDYFCSSAPLTGGYENYLADEMWIRQTFQKRRPMFEKYTTSISGRRLLDVGCATGVFLDVMKSAGWDPSGLDVSSFAVEQARSKGFDVFQGGVDTASWTPESFDLITMWDVIEHLEHPLDIVRKCRTLLRPNGILVISTPDASALIARLLGSYWLGYRSAGEHLYFFGRRTLCNLLSRAGYEVLSQQAVGKYMPLDYVSTRLGYYTRIFRWLRLDGLLRRVRWVLYLNTGDTMCIVARKLG